MLVLLLAEQGNILQKVSCKRNSVWACGTDGVKVIFALLEEIVTLQMSFPPINVWEPSFQRLFTWTFIVRSGGNDGSRNKCKRFRIQNGPEDLLQVIFQVSNHKKVGRARSSKRSNARYNSRSKNTYCSKSKGATIATLGGGSASKLVFVIKKRILARIATSGRSSHRAG